MPKYRVRTVYRKKLQAELMAQDGKTNKQHTRGFQKSDRQSAKKDIRKEIEAHDKNND